MSAISSLYANTPSMDGFLSHGGQNQFPRRIEFHGHRHGTDMTLIEYSPHALEALLGDFRQPGVVGPDEQDTFAPSLDQERSRSLSDWLLREAETGN